MRATRSGAVYLTADASGRFATRLAPGRFRVGAQRDIRDRFEELSELTVADGDTRDIELRLR